MEVGLADEIPWNRFRLRHSPADDVPAKRHLAQARSADARTADRALAQLGFEMVHQGTVSAIAPLTVPFLLRLAADPSAHCRAHALGLVTAVARHEHRGDGTRGAFLRVAKPGWWCDLSGFAMNWSIEASRNAVTADADLLLPLLDDPDPEIRIHTCYVLATAAAGADRITDALRTRLATERTPEVRASLVLAVAELTREHTDPHSTAAWLHALWSGSAQPADIRVPAALAWLCLVDGPVPDDLRTVLDTLVTADLARVLDPVPWIGHVRHRNGLAETLDQMLNDAPPGRHLTPPS